MAIKDFLITGYRGLIKDVTEICCKTTKSEQRIKSLFAQSTNWLPLLDEFRNWLYSEEAEKLSKELVFIG